MSAREEIRRVLDHYKYPTAPMLAAFRAEVLNDAADALEARVADVDVDTRTTWAGMDAAYLRHLAASPAAVPVPDETAGDETGEAVRLRAELAEHVEGLNDLAALVSQWHKRAKDTEARLSAVLDICDREQRGAMRWQDPLPVPEWVAVVQRAALGDDKRQAAKPEVQS